MFPKIEPFTEAHRQSDDRGRAEGTAKGDARSKAEGDAKGSATRKAEALLLILRQRRLAVTQGQARYILACTELATLDRWLGRALAVASADEIFV